MSGIAVLRVEEPCVPQEDGADVSPWHDIALYNEDGTLNFFCEIPMDTTAKFEVATVCPCSCRHQGPQPADTLLHKGCKKQHTNCAYIHITECNLAVIGSTYWSSAASSMGAGMILDKSLHSPELNCDAPAALPSECRCMQ